MEVPKRFLLLLFTLLSLQVIWLVSRGTGSTGRSNSEPFRAKRLSALRTLPPSVCPFRKANLDDVSLPPLPNVAAKQRRVYVESSWGAPIIWDQTQDNALARLQKGPFSVGLVITALGKYVTYFQSIIASADKYFMYDQNVTYILFTDNPDIAMLVKSRRQIVTIQEKDRGWPCNSLLRFELLSSNRNEFAAFDFVYSMDVDLVFKDNVSEEILEYLVATLHAAHYDGSRENFPYDTNPKSAAFISDSEGEYYYAGGFFGGCRDAVIRMAETVNRNLHRDIRELHYIARWHDESYLNRYLIDNLPTKLLSPEYLCFSTKCRGIKRKRVMDPESVTKWVSKVYGKFKSFFVRKHTKYDCSRTNHTL